MLFIGHFTKIVVDLSTPARHGTLPKEGRCGVNLRFVLFLGWATFVLLDSVELFNGTVEMCLLVAKFSVRLQELLGHLFDDDIHIL